MSSILDLVNLTIRSDGNCEWLEVVLQNEDLDDAILHVADLIASIRLGGTESDKYTQWRRVANGEATNDNDTKVILSSYLEQSIGKPGDTTPLSNIQGVIAEAICYDICKNRHTTDGAPIRIELPKFIVTDSGGDGLAVYRRNDGYIFRLWESKKHATDDSATTKIGIASAQLKSKGAKYLAQMSIAEQSVDFEYPGLAEFYGKLVEHWVKRNPEANLGIQVAKNTSTYLDPNPVTYIKRDIDDMNEINQVEFVSLSVPNLDAMAYRVREVLWTGI